MPQRLIARLDAVLNALAMALVLILLGVVAAGIVSRGVNRPFGWTDELSGVLMVWLAATGWMIATRRGSHIRIMLLLGMLRGDKRRAAERVISACLAVLGAALAWNAAILIRSNADVEIISLPFSSAWLYVPLLPAGLVTAIQALADLASPPAKSARETAFP